MEDLNDILTKEQGRLEESLSITEKLNILYNLIILKNSFGIHNFYKDVKKIIDYYIELIKTSDFGYDSINYKKLDKVLQCLSSEEQISFLKYSISIISRELPEHDIDWFLSKLNKAEINNIIRKRSIIMYPKILFLFAGTEVLNLIIVFIVFILITYIILLPAPYSSWEIFNLHYVNYSSNFFINHLLNILSLFGNIDTDFKIVSRNGLGLVVLIFAKIVFVLLIVNFIYKKLSEKITIK